MDLVTCAGSCVTPLLIAVAFDALGLVLLFVGIFANLRVDGRFYGDFLIYSGSLLIFVSLGCWLMWYVGNIRAPGWDRDGAQPRDGVVERLARKISRRMSQKPRAAALEDEERSRVGSTPSPRKASRVTWGKNHAHHNEGYDDSLDYNTTAEEEEKSAVEEEEI
ncbi:putative transmembrane protein 238-like [Scophthalmus maximus]|uniref:Putative transmembrane protein 238-like n=1 Tax=Scophthalmus maximus TaxID=52904 RepID=A0A2U9CUT9_SCOMX|nr:putative transmembrane protein 238-like [Scophthalmus maximus]